MMLTPGEARMMRSRPPGQLQRVLGPPAEVETSLVAEHTPQKG
jgi:hypothetical protein